MAVSLGRPHSISQPLRAYGSFGDSVAYGLAIALDAPLLFNGTNFAKTNVRNALE